MTSHADRLFQFRKRWRLILIGQQFRHLEVALFVVLLAEPFCKNIRQVQRDPMVFGSLGEVSNSLSRNRRRRSSALL